MMCYYYLENYLFLAVGSLKFTCKNITQKVVWVEECDKGEFLLDLFEVTGENN